MNGYQVLAKLNGLDESHSRYPHHCQRGNRPPQSTKRRPYARRAEGSLVSMDAVCGDLNFTNPTEGDCLGRIGFRYRLTEIYGSNSTAKPIPTGQSSRA